MGKVWFWFQVHLGSYFILIYSNLSPLRFNRGGISYRLGKNWKPTLYDWYHKPKEIIANVNLRKRKVLIFQPATPAQGYTSMFYTPVPLKSFKCVVSGVFTTGSSLLQRKLKDEKCLVFIQLVFYLVNPEAMLIQFWYLPLEMGI